MQPPERWSSPWILKPGLAGDGHHPDLQDAVRLLTDQPQHQDSIRAQLAPKPDHFLIAGGEGLLATDPVDLCALEERNVGQSRKFAGQQVTQCPSEGGIRNDRDTNGRG